MVNLFLGVPASMLQYDFEESLGYWLTTSHHAYFDVFKEYLVPYGITYRQAQILGWLAVRGPLSQAELAGLMMIEPPSLVGTLDRMEALGLLERKSCPTDRRKNLVHALPAADGMWEQIASCGRTVRAQATHGLSEEEVATLRGLLDRVRTNLTTKAAVESMS
jgi:MarR family transcriptional regulator for hemolysin